MSQNHEYRIQRGRILKILYTAFPDGVHKDTIILTLIDMSFHVTDGTLRGHCDYLAGKGYVEIHSDRHSPDYTAIITPKGIDLLEENIPADPGVQI